MTGPRVLVLSRDALGAALLGLAIELAGGRPVFLSNGDSPREALRRLRPAIVLIDCDDDRACTETVIGPVLMTGARVVVVSSRHSRRSPRDVDALVERLGIRGVRLPLHADALASVLRDTLD